MVRNIESLSLMKSDSSELTTCLSWRKASESLAHTAEYLGQIPVSDLHAAREPAVLLATSFGKYRV